MRMQALPRRVPVLQCLPLCLKPERLAGAISIHGTRLHLRRKSPCGFSTFQSVCADHGPFA